MQTVYVMSKSKKLSPWDAVTKVELDNHAKKRRMYKLKDLSPSSKLKCGPPRIGFLLGDSWNARFVKTVSEYRVGLYCDAPYLEDLDWKGLGLVLAGGFASRTLRYQSFTRWPKGDLDLFLVGHKGPESVEKTIRTVADRLVARAIDGAVVIHRSVGCITFTFDDKERGRQEVQIVLRYYRDIREVLQGFDLGSCSVGFDGSEVWLTEAGKFAMEHGLNVLNLRERRPSYELRISKYMSRGWGLILPRLDVNSLGAVKFPGSLPYLRITYVSHEQNPCKCCIDALAAPTRPPGKDFLTYSMYDDPIQHEYGDSDKMVLRNLRAIEWGSNIEIGLCGQAVYKPKMSLLDIQPTINAQLLISALKKSLVVKSLNALAVRALLGQKRGEGVLKKIAEENWPTADELQGLCDARMKELTSHEKWPFKIPPGILAATPLSAPKKIYPEELLSGKEWYGSHYLED
jgi:hypothetical protein